MREVAGLQKCGSDWTARMYLDDVSLRPNMNQQFRDSALSKGWFDAWMSV
jgi:hypothetical protein